MNRERIHWYVDWCVIALFLTCVLGTTTTLFLYGKLVRIAPVIVFVALGVLFLNHVSIKKCFQSKDKEFFLMSGGILLSVINMILVKSRIGAFFTIADILLILYLADKVHFDKLQLKIIVAPCLLNWFYWQFVNKESYGFSSFNTNIPPLFMMFFFLIFITYLLCLYPNVFKVSKWFYHLAAFIVAALLIKRAMDFHCRGVALSLVAWIVAYFVLPKKKLTIPLVMGLSLLFPAVYGLLYGFLSDKVVLDDVLVFGKRLFSGRDIIWIEFFKVFRYHPITGIGSNFDLMLPDLAPYLRATHHVFLDLLFIHGIPVLLIVLYLMYKRIGEVISSSTGFARDVCLASVYGSLAIGTFENAYILSPYNMMFLMIFVIYHSLLQEQTI